MFENLNLKEKDYSERLELSILRKIDFENEIEVKLYIEILKKNIRFMKKMRKQLKKRFSSLDSPDIVQKPICFGIFSKYKEYKALSKALARSDNKSDFKTAPKNV